MKDEYLRDHSIEPEFVERKDSLKMHKERISKIRKKQLKKQFSFDAEKIVENRELLDIGCPLSSVENSVYEFSSVNIIISLWRSCVFCVFCRLILIIKYNYLKEKSYCKIFSH